MIQETMLLSGKYYYPVKYEDHNNRRFFSFKFNPKLMADIKAMEGAKYHDYPGADPVSPTFKQLGWKKVWSVPLTDHNIFQLQYITRGASNPYAPYDRAYIDYTSTRTPYDHQLDLTRHGLTVHYGIWAAEMGTGKSLAAIELMEASGFSDWWWIAPRSALQSVELELEKWNSRITPAMYTYDGLKKVIANWPTGKPAPHGVIFDESSLIKNHTSQRSQAAKWLADAIRREWGPNGFVILMSGTPAPKSPVDWWHQAQVACPGFLREGSRQKFERRLSLIVDKNNEITGGVYPHRVTWYDDENKCAKCGRYEHEGDHTPESLEYHLFEPSTNEIELLYKRLKGLVNVKFKKDCLSLPDKTYRVIKIKPKTSTVNASKIIVAKSPTTIQALTLLRELSDGFQYQKTKIGEVECPLCRGAGEYEVHYDPNQTQCKLCYFDKSEHGQPDFDIGHEFDPIPSDPNDPGVTFLTKIDVCPTCNGRKVVDKFETTVKQLDCPKEDVLRDLLEEHDSVGRFVVYAGFTGSIDKIVSVVSGEKWDYIKVDGRGWNSSLPGRAKEWLKAFQNPKEDRKICFIGQPESGGMGLTLTASPSIFYYSNTFSGQARTQSEDRIHRAGMDANRGATIIDCIHLPSDQLVLDNLKKKRNLELTTLGELRDVMETEVENGFTRD